MEERIIGLIEKMYAELTGIKTRMVTKEDVVKIETKIENEVIDKVRALFDNREVQAEINDKIQSTLTRIETKIDVLQMETAHIRRIK